MFRELLAEIVSRTDGAIGVVLMGVDGLTVDQVVANSSRGDVEAMAMELSMVLRELRKVTSQVDAGVPEEVMIRTTALTTLVRVLSDEYFVALALQPTASVGKARFLLRSAAPRLQEHL